MLKYAKFKLSKTMYDFFAFSIFHGTPIRILRNTSILQNIVWETLQCGMVEHKASVRYF